MEQDNIIFSDDYKIDVLDLYVIHPDQVEPLFWKRISQNPIDADVMRAFFDSSFISVDIKDRQGNDLMHYAISKKSEDFFNLLLEYGMPEIDAWGNTLLHIVAKEGFKGGILPLLEKGMDVNIQNRMGFTALHYATISGDIESVELLMSNGSIVEEKNNQGFSPMHFAIERHHFDIVRLFIKAGVEIDECLEKFKGVKGYNQVVKVVKGIKKELNKK